MKTSHGAVPYDGATVRQSCLDLCDRLRADVQAHPAVWDLSHVYDLGLGIRGELVRDHDVTREEELDALLLCDALELPVKRREGVMEERGRERVFTQTRRVNIYFHEIPGEIQLVVLNERRTHRDSAGFQEGEHHSSAKYELVHLVEEGLDHGDLRGHFGASHDGGERSLRTLHSALQIVELL